MDAWTYLAFVAGALTSTGFLPQIFKGLRSKKMDDVSIMMPAVLGIGMFLWLLYGLVREDLAIIVANIVGAGLATTIVVMKLRYGSSGGTATTPIR